MHRLCEFVFFETLSEPIRGATNKDDEPMGGGFRQSWKRSDRNTVISRVSLSSKFSIMYTK